MQAVKTAKLLLFFLVGGISLALVILAAVIAFQIAAALAPYRTIMAVFAVIVLLSLLAYGADRLYCKWRTGRLHLAEQEAKIRALNVGIADGSNLEMDGLKIIRFLGGGRVTIKETEHPLLELPAPTLPTSPAYREIASQIAPGRILLGCGVQGYIWGDITDLLSTAIVGRPGTGKTTMLRFVVAMLLRIGGIPVLWDPHGSIVDELGDVLTVAESGSEIIASSAVVEQELQSRLAARRQGVAPLARPMLLIADEWPIISQIAPDAIAVARRIVLEGRKVAMYALICGQGLPAQLLGGTLVRDALSSRYVFNTTAQQARMAGLDNDTAKAMLAQLDTAGPGRAILASATRRPEIVAIPATTADDIRSLVHSHSQTGPLSRSAKAATMNVMNAMNAPVKSDERSMNIQVTDEERQLILAAAKSQMLTTGKVIRTKVRDALGWNNSDFPKIKHVLDEHEEED